MVGATHHTRMTSPAWKESLGMSLPHSCLMVGFLTLSWWPQGLMSVSLLSQSPLDLRVKWMSHLTGTRCHEKSRYSKCFPKPVKKLVPFQFCKDVGVNQTPECYQFTSKTLHGKEMAGDGFVRLIIHVSTAPSDWNRSPFLLRLNTIQAKILIFYSCSCFQSSLTTFFYPQLPSKNPKNHYCPWLRSNLP